MIDSYKLMKLGQMITNELKDMRFNSECVLTMKLDKDKLLKLDEDLYYRQYPDGKDYVPTDGEINVKFDNLTIVVTE